MCQSMVNIQSPAAEIRRGKKEEEEEGRTNHSMKIYMVSLLHRATIINIHYKVCIGEGKPPQEILLWDNC